MTDHSHAAPPPGPPLNHELSDADPRPVLKFLAFLVIVTGAIAVLVVFFYNYLEHREATEKTARYPMSLSDQERPLPPPPRLQTYPFEDIKDLRRAEQPLLTTYEWIDQSAGTVRIPIERAMDILAERGLPHRAPGEPAAPAEGQGAEPGAGGSATTGGAGGTPVQQEAPAAGSSGQAPQPH
jgi:hypothetical protein